MTQRDSLVQLYEEKLASFRACLQLMKEKTRPLMANDLPGLEESLDRENLLLRELAELDSSIIELLKNVDVAVGLNPNAALEVDARTLDPQCSAQLLVVRNLLEEVCKEIRRVTHKNGQLIAGGLQFTSVMLDVLCPAKTYSSSGGGSQIPATAIVSVNC
jgi:flagellar biosynthesis/type III secretory pathway chaperone